jgi:tetratricopeptide (TPR) repeat protein
VRLAALLVAPGTPPLVTREPPPLGSRVSFSQLARLQRIVAASRGALREVAPRLAPHDRVCYWEMPRLAEFAFQNSKALQVWYHDSTLTWSAFGGQRGLSLAVAAGVEYRYAETPFAAAVPGRSIALFQQAAALSLANQEERSDSLMRVAQTLAGHERGPFLAMLFENMALNAFRRQRFERADSLNERALAVGPESGTYWLLRAARQAMVGDRDAARISIRRSLQLEPGNETARDVARQLGELR